MIDDKWLLNAVPADVSDKAGWGNCVWCVCVCVCVCVCERVSVCVCVCVCVSFRGLFE